MDEERKRLLMEAFELISRFPEDELKKVLNMFEEENKNEKH